jgi:uncharacterized protein
VAVCLLDANVLIALVWPEHVSYEPVTRWFARHSRAGWATCPFTEAGFVRVISNPAFSPNALSPVNAVRLLEDNLKIPGHVFWPDAISFPKAIQSLESRFTGHRQTTDLYLLGLTAHYKGKLATLDKGICSWATEELVELVA